MNKINQMNSSENTRALNEELIKLDLPDTYKVLYNKELYTHSYVVDMKYSPRQSHAKA